MSIELEPISRIKYGLTHNQIMFYTRITDEVNNGSPVL